MCAKKSREYIKANVTFDFFNPRDTRAIRELKKLYLSRGGSLRSFFPKFKAVRPVDKVITPRDKKHFQLLDEKQRGQHIGKLEEFRHERNIGKSIIVVARDQAKNGQVVGFQEIALYPGRSIPTIAFNYVHPAYRRQGIATSFHAISQLTVAELGYSGIAHSTPINPPSVKSLRKAGLSGSAAVYGKRVKRFKGR